MFSSSFPGRLREWLVYLYIDRVLGVATPALKRFREGVSTLDSEREWPRMRIAIAGKTQSRKYAHAPTELTSI